MRGLQNLHIQHPDTRREVNYHALNGNEIFGEDTRTRDRVVFDVIMGAFRRPSGQIENLLCQDLIRARVDLISLDESPDHRRLVHTDDEVSSMQKTRDAISRVASLTSRPLTEIQERYLATLVHQQVSADQLSQGVRARIGKLPPKVQWCYLGGIIMPEDYKTVEDMLESIREQDE